MSDRAIIVFLVLSVIGWGVALHAFHNDLKLLDRRFVLLVAAATTALLLYNVALHLLGLAPS